MRVILQRGEYHGATLGDVITAVVGTMFSNSSEQAAGLLESARNMPHTALVRTAGTLYVEEEELEDGALTCFARATPTSASYNIRVTAQFVYSCNCKHSSEYKRPCAHVLAAFFAAQRHTNLAAYNVWGSKWIGEIWHAATWLKRHAHFVKRAGVKGAELQQT
eukprot:IDg5780t1